MNVQEHFEKNGYVILSGALNKQSCDELTNHMFELHKSGALEKDSQCPESDAIYGDSKMDQLLADFAEPLGKQIINIRNEIIDAKKASEAAKKVLIDKQSKKLDKWSELIASRNVKILENLKKNETKFDWAVRGLLSAAVRPLVGAGMGATGGILFGDEETDLMYWIAAGATAGQMQKMIQRSGKFGTNLDKGKILGIIDREMTQLTMQKVRDLMSGTSSSKLNSYGGPTEKISKMLFREVDSPVQEKSAIAVAEQMQRYYFRKINDITKGYTDDEIAAAVSINRGKQLTKDTPSNVEKLSKDLRSYMDEFKDL